MVAQQDMFATPPPALPTDPAGCLLWLSAHGWDQYGTRQRGMTTYHRLRRGDEYEDVPEGELPWFVAAEAQNGG